jgi:rod shape-determining protein MreC
MAGNADVQPGDLLTTSGVDGVYPPGLPVAKVVKVERKAESGFARISCEPQALTDGARHVMVLSALAQQVPPRPPPEDAPVLVQKRGAAAKEAREAKDIKDNKEKDKEKKGPAP